MAEILGGVALTAVFLLYLAWDCRPALRSRPYALRKYLKRYEWKLAFNSVGKRLTWEVGDEISVDYYPTGNGQTGGHFVGIRMTGEDMTTPIRMDADCKPENSAHRAPVWRDIILMVLRRVEELEQKNLLQV